ncbi:DUF1772 domain-containing protein [Hoeflea alexandrii]|uniref:anthrone oxygenase family protein n=1 Tax=Hoeflea alexandrii TaxID=288436 RepID=UPI00226D9F86|nr:anthrone oxygenase family protein [Hoeflea alexandrii]MCY0152765.1 DUF1772 domain-containing protein [Hoeflea alexandrii]
MQVLNVEIMRSIFMVLFMGLVILSLVIMIYAALNLDGTVRSLLLLAGISYVIGVFAVTAAGNVPLNNQLAALAPSHIAGPGFLERGLHDPLGRSQQLEDAGLFPGVGVDPGRAHRPVNIMAQAVFAPPCLDRPRRGLYVGLPAPSGLILPAHGVLLVRL